MEKMGMSAIGYDMSNVPTLAGFSTQTINEGDLIFKFCIVFWFYNHVLSMLMVPCAFIDYGTMCYS